MISVVCFCFNVSVIDISEKCHDVTSEIRIRTLAHAKFAKKFRLSDFYVSVKTKLRSSRYDMANYPYPSVLHYKITRTRVRFKIRLQLALESCSHQSSLFAKWNFSKECIKPINTIQEYEPHREQNATNAIHEKSSLKMSTGCNRAQIAS